MAKSRIYKTEEGKRQVLNYYESLLKNWIHPCRQFTIETAFGHTFIIECGNKNAPAVLLIHGSGSNSAMWTADAAVLSKMYHVIAVDIIGECGKSAENRHHFKGNNYSDWLMEIIETIGLKQVSLIGCSLGGWIAIDFAIKHPDKTEKLVLLATAGITQIKPSTIFWIIITSFMGSRGFHKLNQMVYGNLEIDQHALEFASLLKKHYKPRTDVLPLFKTKSLNKIKAPTLFIGGENDCFYHSHKTALRLKATINDFQYSVLKNTSHVLLNQTNRIMEFLKAK